MRYITFVRGYGYACRPFLATMWSRFVFRCGLMALMVPVYLLTGSFIAASVVPAVVYAVSGRAR
jgi:hypothetical protein